MKGKIYGGSGKEGKSISVRFKAVPCKRSISNAGVLVCGLHFIRLHDVFLHLLLHVLPDEPGLNLYIYAGNFRQRHGGRYGSDADHPPGGEGQYEKSGYIYADNLCDLLSDPVFLRRKIHHAAVCTDRRYQYVFHYDKRVSPDDRGGDDRSEERRVGKECL